MKGNKVSASIVTYNNSIEDLSALLDSLENSVVEIVYIMDNSPANQLESALRKYLKVKYIALHHNPGFGIAHNIAVQNAILRGNKYHFVVNPDIAFEKEIISEMLKYIEMDKTIGMMMPKILNMDGSVQYLPKLLPTPWGMLLRKLKYPQGIYNRFVEKYELRNECDTIMNVPIISGCFSLLSLEVVKDIGFYDERFFMYFEDFDLSRRIHNKYKTIYYPLVSVYHGYESEANKKMKLFKIFFLSAVRYFNKWGWLFDRSRVNVNTVLLKDLGLYK